MSRKITGMIMRIYIVDGKTEPFITWISTYFLRHSCNFKFYTIDFYKKRKKSGSDSSGVWFKAIVQDTQV